MKPKKVLAVLLASLMLFSMTGCKNKGVRFDVYDESEHDFYPRAAGFYKEYFDGMIEEAKKEIPDVIKDITTYKVDIEQKSDYGYIKDSHRKYEIDVDEISCDLDSITFGSYYLLSYDKSKEAKNPQGLTIGLKVEVHVIGTDKATGEHIDDIFISGVNVSRQGMMMTKDGSEIVDAGKVYCDFSFFNACYYIITYYEPLDKPIYTVEALNNVEHKCHETFLDREYIKSIETNYDWNELEQDPENRYVEYVNLGYFEHDGGKMWKINEQRELSIPFYQDYYQTSDPYMKVILADEEDN